MAGRLRAVQGVPKSAAPCPSTGILTPGFGRAAPPTSNGGDILNADEITCPECAETIKAAAKVCKHCGHRLANAVEPDSGAEPSPLNKSRLGALAAFGGIAGIFIAALVAHNAQGGPSSAFTSAERPEAIENASDAAVAEAIANAQRQADAQFAAEEEVTAKKTNGGMDNIDLRIAAEANLKALLKDADAAKLRNIFLARIEGGNLLLCGQVNSKNAFGAYTGFKRFIASPNSDAPTLVEGEGSGLSRSQFQQAYSSVCTNPVQRF